jgi:hypothetical protein
MVFAQTISTLSDGRHVLPLARVVDFGDLAPRKTPVDFKEVRFV